MSETMPKTEPRAAAAPAPEDARRKTGLYLGLAGGVILLDQLTKFVVERTMIPYRPTEVLGEFFRLTFIYNRGAAFGLNVGEWSRVFFIVLAAVAVIVLGVMYRNTPWADRMRLVAIASVSGGAVGNLIDRVRSSRGVVDFFDFGIPAYRWPVFNIADIAVTCGALLLAVSLWREEKAMERELGTDDAA